MAGIIVKRVSIDIGVSDLLEEVSDRDLTQEYRRRNPESFVIDAERREGWRDFADELRAARNHLDALHFEVLIVRMLAMAGVTRLSSAPLRAMVV